MRGLLKRVVSEPGADTAESFVRRIRLLAATYTVVVWGQSGDERVEVELDYPPR
jgi:hypothetical protein